MQAKSKKGKVRRVGVISDTHGLVRAGLLEALSGVEMIIHAGDVGGPRVLEALRAQAPVVAVRGNMDGGPWARDLRQAEVIEIDRSLLYVLHDAQEIDLDPAAAGFRAVISGHTHRPSLCRREGVLFLNPGSAGPRRFRLPVSAAILHLEGESVEAELIELQD
jgi:putative phosphoesterase